MNLSPCDLRYFLTIVQDPMFTWHVQDTLILPDRCSGTSLLPDRCSGTSLFPDRFSGHPFYLTDVQDLITWHVQDPLFTIHIFRTSFSHSAVQEPPLLPNKCSRTTLLRDRCSGCCMNLLPHVVWTYYLADVQDPLITWQMFRIPLLPGRCSGFLYYLANVQDPLITWQTFRDPLITCQMFRDPLVPDRCWGILLMMFRDPAVWRDPKSCTSHSWRITDVEHPSQRSNHWHCTCKIQ